MVVLDGPTHDGRDAKEYYAEREEQIKSLGIAVIRFKNEMVYEHRDEVVAKIRENVQMLAEAARLQSASDERQTAR